MHLMNVPATFEVRIYIYLTIATHAMALQQEKRLWSVLHFATALTYRPNITASAMLLKRSKKFLVRLEGGGSPL